MPVEGQFSPFESIRKVRDLITRGDIWTQEVILAITSTDIIIKDGSTRVSSAYSYTVQLTSEVDMYHGALKMGGWVIFEGGHIIG